VALALDAANDLYIADQNSSTIRKVSNGVITTFAGTGPSDFFPGPGPSGFLCGGITDGTPAIAASLCQPTAVAADSSGNVYISDSGFATVLKVSNGLITTVSGGPFPPCDNCPATSTQLQFVNSLAVDPSNNLFIADSVRVRKVANGIITTPAGNGNSIGDGGAPLSAQLEQPVALAVDSTGANLYIGGTARVRKISGHVIQTVAGNGSTYILKNDGDHGPALSAQMSPNALALDASGNLYIADTEDNEIREVSNGGIASFAGSGALPPNTLAQTNNGAPAANAELNAPRAVAVDSSGNLYLTDNYNAVREVSNGIINVVAGNGTLGCGGQNGPALDAQFGNAWGLAVDAQASLYVLNAGCGDILKISNGTVTNLATIRGSALAVDPSGNAFIAGGNSVYKVSGGVLTTIAGTGTAGFSGDGAPALNALLDSPLGLAVDASGKVYVADLGNNRIRVLTPSGPSCSYSVDPTSSTINGDGGSLTVNVQAASGCAWAVQNLPNWITLSVSATGSGPASLVLDIAFNSGATRSVPLSIAGLAVTVSQSGSAISIATGGIVNAASYQSPVAAGSIAAVFGVFPFSSTFSATSFPLPTSADGFTLQLTDTLLAPLFVATAGQVNIQIPWELSGQSQATLTVPSTGASQSFNLAAYAPGIFAINGQGNGQGAIVDTAYHVVDASNPAVAGSSIVQIYCTGLGPVVSQEMTGEPNAINLSGATTTTPVVTIGGAAAQVSYSGLAPNLVGLYQVNAQVPATATRGPAVPVSLSIGGVVSNSVTIAIQ
jgi:uncharacterized protein (TIGR03437 family)